LSSLCFKFYLLTTSHASSPDSCPLPRRTIPGSSQQTPAAETDLKRHGQHAGSVNETTGVEAYPVVQDFGVIKRWKF